MIYPEIALICLDSALMPHRGRENQWNGNFEWARAPATFNVQRATCDLQLATSLPTRHKRNKPHETRMNIEANASPKA